jgi:hypothetical protein
LVVYIVEVEGSEVGDGVESAEYALGRDLLQLQTLEGDGHKGHALLEGAKAGFRGVLPNREGY